MPWEAVTADGPRRHSPSSRAPWKLREAALPPQGALTFLPCPPKHPALQSQDRGSLGSSAPSPLSGTSFLPPCARQLPLTRQGTARTVSAPLRDNPGTQQELGASSLLPTAS